RVEAQDLVLDLVGQLRVLVFVDQLLRHLQAAEALDLALRAAVPDAVGSPQDVIGPGGLDHLAEHVAARLGARARKRREGATELKIDVLDARVLLEDAKDLADPRDLLVAGFLRRRDALAGAAGERRNRRPAVARMIDNEVQIGPVLRSLLEIVWRARLLVERAERQALVHAEILHAELLRALPEGIGDLLVVHEPGLFAELGAGVHL